MFRFQKGAKAWCAVHFSQISHVKLQKGVEVLGYTFSDFRFQISDFRKESRLGLHRTLSRFQISDFRFQISEESRGSRGSGLHFSQISDFRFQISDFRFQKGVEA